MRTTPAKAKQVHYEDALEHPYKKYESHPYWKRLNKGISDLVKNQDLVEREERPISWGIFAKCSFNGRAAINSRSLRGDTHLSGTRDIYRDLSGLLFVQIDSTPFLPTFFEFRKNRFQILADIFAACHSIWKRDAPNSPSLRFGRANLLKVGFVRSLPDQSSPGVVRRDNEGVSFTASFNLEISNLPEGEASNHNITENLETMVDRSTSGSRNESRFSCVNPFQPKGRAPVDVLLEV